MKRIRILSIAAAIAAAASVALAAKLDNPGFEKDFTVTDTISHWGGNGELFGGCHQVTAGEAGQPAKAAEGVRCIGIDVPAKLWSGIWQQVDGGAKMPFHWKAKYLIQGGALPDSVATFMKVEFYGDAGLISAVEGEWHRADTKGLWVDDTMKGTTPEGTKAVRFVLIAGDNAEGAEVKNRIFWDGVDTQ